MSWAAGTGLVALLDGLIWRHRALAVVLGMVIGAVMIVVFTAAGHVVARAGGAPAGRHDATPGPEGAPSRSGGDLVAWSTQMTGIDPPDEEREGP
ncbi:hypothetical protein [Brachybacterium sp. GPGPB12]|uniref:hypothetical protein n=1 Tax=Brachybacterium sp. GPGPB12 TaxID=3023517 RepID=UPI00313437FE